jgi:DNA-binding response OmpR family regulator
MLSPAAGAVLDRLRPMEAPRVVIVADDLIWRSRLRAAAERAGASVVGDSGDMVIVDLTGRGYDGVNAVADAAGTGATVIAVGQHEDLELRKRALSAGAKRVYSYNKMFSDGARVIAGWLAARG